jgi:AcrR family transcriptional regulator
MKPRAKREALSRERILRTALAIVDREGLAAISMRRIGDELGVEAMSLYNHVANKAAILDGVFETVLAELPITRRATSWQAALRDRARALRGVLRAHPNVLPLFATRSAVTPAAIAHVEGALELLRTAGFSPLDALGSFQVLYAFVVGHTVAAYSPSQPDEASEPDYELLDEQRFPRVREMARAMAHHDLDKEFELGLGAMLAGLDAHRRRVT